MLEDREFTLPEVAYLCGLPMQEAIDEAVGYYEEDE